jgi:hypothetical protein
MTEAMVPSAAKLPRLALCTMVRNEARALPEWLAFHELCGVTLFRIYDDGSNDGTPALLEGLARWFPIELVPCRTLPSAPPFARQGATFEHGARALEGRADFVGFIDVDEFLFDAALRPLPVALAEFPADVGAIAVNQTVFGSSGHVAATFEPVTQRFTRRAADDYSEHEWIKTVARPEAVSAFDTCHAVRLAFGRYLMGDREPYEQTGWHAGHAARIATRGLRLHHYMLKSLEEFREKQRRGAIDDQPDLVPPRFIDSYFTKRDPAANEVEDRTLLALAEKLHERLTEALAASCSYFMQREG